LRKATDKPTVPTTKSLKSEPKKKEQMWESNKAPLPQDGADQCPDKHQTQAARAEQRKSV